MLKFALLAEALDREGIGHCSQFLVPEPINAEIASLAHDPTYVADVFSGHISRQMERDIGFPMNPSVVLRSRAACGGTLLAARHALQTGIGCNSAGGSHHARWSQGAGFCVFNDVAIAIRCLIGEGLIERPLIIDLDCHQGDGTADIFSQDADVFTFSMHAEKNYPDKKRPSDVDVGLPDGVEDDDYLQSLSAHIPDLIDRHQPDIVFYNAGVDVHVADRLGRLAMSAEGISARDRYVVETVRSRGLPLTCVIGGGYSADPMSIAELHLSVFRAAKAAA